jgi:hypothetical protein
MMGKQNIQLLLFNNRNYYHFGQYLFDTPKTWKNIGIDEIVTLFFTI